MTRQTKILLLTLLTLCEIACFFLCRWSVASATIVYTLVGIGVSIIPLLNTTQTLHPSVIPDKYKRYSYLLYLATLLLICNWIKNVFKAHIYGTPFDLHMGDMMLFMREMSMRYIAHQHVYDPVTSIYGFPVHAVYLPAFWMPYTIPLYFGADMRWASLIAFIAAMLTVSLIRRKYFRPIYFLLLIPVAFLTYLILSGATYYLMFTQEAIVLFYVALLAWSLMYEYWVPAGIAAAMCIMSRYFIGVPLLAGVVWLFTRDPAAARRTALATITTLIFILTISRSWGDMGYFFQIPFLYVGFLSNTSTFESFRHIYQGSVGFASFLHADTIYIITAINIVFLILVPPGYFIFAHCNLPGRREGLIILCGIKIFLVLFLTTLSLPFGYVLYTSSIVSIMLLRDAIADISAK